MANLDLTNLVATQSSNDSTSWFRNDVQNSLRRSDGNAFFYVRFTNKMKIWWRKPKLQRWEWVIPWLKLGKMMGNRCHQILVVNEGRDLEPWPSLGRSCWFFAGNQTRRLRFKSFKHCWYKCYTKAVYCFVKGVSMKRQFCWLMTRYSDIQNAIFTVSSKLWMFERSWQAKD